MMELKSRKQTSTNYQVYRISNSLGMSATVSNYGLRIVSLYVSDNQGKFDDVVLGFNSINDYKSETGQYFGCIVGQYANRIENGTFLLNNQKVELDTNDGNNHLHGGFKGYHQVDWELVSYQKNHIKFQHFFAEKDYLYPGNTMVTVRYEITEKNELILEYQAKSDKETIINLSNHSFFNLKGEGKGSILDHEITVHAHQYLAVDEKLIPIGVDSVENSPFDFREKSEIKQRLNLNSEQLKFTKGFDHCYVLKKDTNDELIHAATIEEKSSGRIMKVLTTEPGVQLYTGNFLNGKLIGKTGKQYEKHAGLCLETQRFPNSPNRRDFPNSFLKANQMYTSKTIYQFLTTNDQINKI